MAPNNQLVGFLQRLDENQSAYKLLSAREELKDWAELIDGHWYEFTWPTKVGDIPFVLREGRDRFLLLSHDHRVVTQLLETLGLLAHLRRPRIHVSKFVKDSIAPLNQPDATFGRQYRISNVFAAIDGYGRSLQTIALWGDDLINAQLFTALLRESSPYRATVRDLVTNNDIASIGSLGEINFFYRDEKQLRRVDNFFRHLKRGGYIQWQTPREARENPLTDAEDGWDRDDP